MYSGACFHILLFYRIFLLSIPTRWGSCLCRLFTLTSCWPRGVPIYSPHLPTFARRLVAGPGPLYQVCMSSGVFTIAGYWGAPARSPSPFCFMSGVAIRPSFSWVVGCPGGMWLFVSGVTYANSAVFAPSLDAFSVPRALSIAPMRDACCNEFISCDAFFLQNSSF